MKVSQPKASFSCGFGEFIPPYDAMRTAPDPGSVLLKFLQSAYEASASLGRWDRKALGREQDGLGGILRRTETLRMWRDSVTAPVGRPSGNSDNMTNLSDDRGTSKAYTMSRLRLPAGE